MTWVGLGWREEGCICGRLISAWGYTVVRIPQLDMKGCYKMCVGDESCCLTIVTKGMCQ